MILVIDDNEDIRVMLEELLSDKYNVVGASNGREGIRYATRYVPDLVVCDVMMPVMDGLECCRNIKEEISTSHIPVLMLTACSMDEQKVAGYESGADGYISKPFNSAVLRSRIENLLENRRRIKNIWGASHDRSEGDLSKPANGSAERRIVSTDVENEFYARFLKLVESRMGDADMNVDQLASEMGLGRSQLYRKIKALTNYSPVELIRNLRLKRARHLLTTTDRSISEIAYEVGFSTPAYFSKCYREAYGETPTELRSRL
ncbi:alkaline phosphatase synthesis transcriptional regulatory protein PhoP [Muribaculaceae bacterium]|nr:alkaline phosphatase synthesis transcriptional regulatory protein PhoP [Muribaculaceae bacterium]